MNKKVITLAVLAGMAASSAAVADITPYARAHVAMESWDDAQKGYGSGTNTNDYKASVDALVTQAIIDGDVTAGAQATALEKALDASGKAVFNESQGVAEDLDLRSRKSVFGVKGSEDVGGGNKVFFKMEWEVKVDEGSALTGRDQYLGLKFGQGSVKIGTMSNNYKQMGGKMDALWHTGLEGRGFLNTMSGAHGGKSVNGGRSTNTIQYSSPKMGGMQLVVNRTFESAQTSVAAVDGTDSTEETMGLGFRAEGKKWLAFFDYIDMVCNGAGVAGCLTDGTEAGFKLGGKFDFGMVSLRAQIEDLNDIKTKDSLFGSDNDIGKYTYLQGVIKMGKNNQVVVSYGAEGDISSGMAVAFIHKTGGKSKVYIGYGDRSSDFDGATGAEDTANEQSMITAGWSASFK